MHTNTAALAARRLRRRGGFSLIELAMVLAIIALLVAGIMLFFSNANTSQKTNDAMQEVAAIEQIVRSMYGSQPNYTGLTAAQITGSGQLPAKWTNGAAIIDPFGSAVTIAVGTVNTAGDSFSIDMTGIPNTACTRMAAMDLGQALVSLTVSGAAAVSGAMGPTAANAACSKGSANTLTWLLQ